MSFFPRYRGKRRGQILIFDIDRTTRNVCTSNGRAFQLNLDMSWLKDESLEDSANLPLHCHPEFPASLDTLKVSVPPAVKAAAATANLDIFWLKDESLEDSAKLPDTHIIAPEIVEDLPPSPSSYAELRRDE